MNENGYCPHCGADLDGEDIVSTFIISGMEEEKALDMAIKYYGYDEGNTKFGRQIGLYDINCDRISEWKCPDCNKTWKIL